ncbi:hypothetical protein HPP92_000558 [Vanilla planifolia]|uniref:WRKY domain-containing protein n=1 Tax=Vanilla planifolia TaxID=51239 RepID=A0A835VL07_VANPL|nr:hypothetical protein HPP92_000558 [Vanilla planifolia]
MAIVVTKLIQQRSKPAGSILQLPAGLDKEQEEGDEQEKEESTAEMEQQCASVRWLIHGRSLDDGHNWRKYGQKDILGSIFPRCSHRHSQGCQAKSKFSAQTKIHTSLTSPQWDSHVYPC